VNLFALAALGLGWVAAAEPGHPQIGAGPLLAAHRGGAALWPENSLLAFRNSVALGADFLELDVHLSRDGEVVVIHDATLDRTTSGAGPVTDRTLAELRAVGLRDKSGGASAERIPSLGDVLALASAAGRAVLLEIKPDARGVRYPGIEERVLAAVDAHRMARSVVVMAFEAETWRRVRELRPEVRAGALYSSRTLRAPGRVARAIEEAHAAGVGFVGLQHPLATAEVQALAGQAGILLGAWTVNAPADMRRLIDQRVGVLITDRPDIARQLLEQRGNP